MSDFGVKIKGILSTSAKFVSKTATSAAKATKYKMDELSTLSKRRDLISDLGAKVYELSKSGLELPADAAELVKQIIALEGDLESMRADHAAQKAAAAEQHAAEKAARAAEKAAAKAAAASEQGTTPMEVELPEVQMPAAEAVVVPTLDVEETAAPEEASETDVPTLNV